MGGINEVPQERETIVRIRERTEGDGEEENSKCRREGLGELDGRGLEGGTRWEIRGRVNSSEENWRGRFEGKL